MMSNEHGDKYEEVGPSQLEKIAHYLEDTQHHQKKGYELSTNSTQNLPLENSSMIDSSEYVEVDKHKQENSYDLIDQPDQLYSQIFTQRAASILSLPLEMLNEGKSVCGQFEKVNRSQEDIRHESVDQHHQHISPYSTIKDCY